MDPAPVGAKDPMVGIFLSLAFPGLGHLYAGNVRSFVVFLAIEAGLLAKGWIGPLVVLHLFQAIAAGGAVKLWNRDNAVAATIGVPPPSPAGSGRRDEPPPLPRAAPEAAPEPSPPPPPPAVLDADAFLAELQTAWRDHRTSAITARQFADRKWRAIRAVRVDHEDEGEALVAAAHELAKAGVLTSEEIGQLQARVTP